jgi:hypothetical protein
MKHIGPYKHIRFSQRAGRQRILIHNNRRQQKTIKDLKTKLADIG